LIKDHAAKRSGQRKIFGTSLKYEYLKMDEFFTDFTEPRFKSQLRFEIVSLIGRYFLKRKSKIILSCAPLLLDLGAGPNYTEGWTHVDFYSLRLRFWKKSLGRKPEIETDLRYPLNCLDNIADGVYSGHTLEHLYPNQAYQLLIEIFRVLKPKCWLRINVPDLKRAVDFYNGKISIPEFKYKAQAISNLTQNWGHHSVWDEELLSRVLEIAGFINIRRVEFGKEGTDKRLIKEEEVRRIETLVLEAQKP
jgi:predicted SAM-dependent methyltransferase